MLHPPVVRSVENWRSLCPWLSPLIPKNTPTPKKFLRGWGQRELGTTILALTEYSYKRILSIELTFKRDVSQIEIRSLRFFCPPSSPRTLGQLDPHTIFRHRTLIAHPGFSVGQMDILLRNTCELSPCPHHLYLNNRFAAPVRILRPEQIALHEMTLRFLLHTSGPLTISRCRPEI